MASHELFPILFATFSCTVATAVCLALGGKPSPKRARAEFEAVDPFERKPGFTDADFYTAFHFYPCDVRRLTLTCGASWMGVSGLSPVPAEILTCSDHFTLGIFAGMLSRITYSPLPMA